MTALDMMATSLEELPQQQIGSLLVKAINNPNNAPDVSQVWMYYPMPRYILGTLEVIDQLIAQGWCEAPAFYQTMLNTQMHDTLALRTLSGELQLWTPAESAAYVKRYPIALISEMDFDEDLIQKGMLNIAGMPTIPMLTPIPLASSGMGGFILDPNNQDAKLSGYRIQSLPKEAQQRFQRSARKLHEMIEPGVWTIQNQLHRLVFNVDACQRELNTLHAREQLTIGPARRKIRQSIAELNKAIGEMRFVVEMQERPSYTSDVKEIAQLMQDLARDYFEYHQSLQPSHDEPAPIDTSAQQTTLFPQTEQEIHKKPKKQARPITLPTFDENGYAPIIAAQPVQAIINGLHNAIVGGNQWTFDEDKAKKALAENEPCSVPYYRYQKDTGQTTLSYRTGENTHLDARAALTLWEEVKNFSPRSVDIILDIFSHLSHNMDESGSAWFFASEHLDHRGMTPITKKHEGGRRAGHRSEDMRETHQAIASMQKLWITIEQYIDTNEQIKRKGAKPQRKKRLYTHTGRVLSIDEMWYQNELTGDEGNTPFPTNSIPIGWRIHSGDWLRTFLEAPNYQVSRLCQTLLHYDPYRQRWEKALGVYIMFHGHMACKGKGGVLTRTIGNMSNEVSLPLEADRPQRTRDRFEKAMNQLVEDHVIDGWNYDTEFHFSKSKKPGEKLQAWIDQTIKIYIAPYKPVIHQPQKEE